MWNTWEQSPPINTKLFLKKNFLFLLFEKKVKESKQNLLSVEYIEVLG